MAGIHILLRNPKYHQFWTTQKGADQPDGSAIDGIIYGSAKNADGKAVVLFCENHQCVEKSNANDVGAMLQLVAVDHQNQHP